MPAGRKPVGKKDMYIGGHVSVAGGILNAFPNAEKIGANSIQFFGSSPRQWAVRMPSEADAARFRSELAARKFGPVFLHAPYLPNLASPSAKLRAKSVESLAGHLRIAEMTGARGLIFHIGSGAELPREKAFGHVVRAMKDILKKAPGEALLIAENSAGGGAKIGAKLEDIGEILDAVGSPRGAACFDTAHAFESGITKYSPAEVRSLALVIKKCLGWKNLAALHVNDSKTPFNSRHDRHENIGKGEIGLAAFRNLMASPDFRKIPWLLEVPGLANEGPDAANIAILHKLHRETLR